MQYVATIQYLQLDFSVVFKIYQLQSISGISNIQYPVQRPAV
jgi:hypothetical protein